MMMFPRKGRVLLLTIALLMAPLAGVALLLYGAGQIAVRRRRRPAADPYIEWLALRDRGELWRARSDVAPRGSTKRRCRAANERSRRLRISRYGGSRCAS